ncbi:hypothetical protein BJY04DRAFT_182579 [Aspergillus karnatakaensis]|uniref:uncharacterized protein n=1 Tax=Aspergillus karnatakaensis TaxID=1810916 RepID=UPI003CCD7872
MAIAEELLSHPTFDVEAYQDQCNSTLFGIAVINGHVDLLKLLIARDDVDKVPVDSLGYTPLMNAVACNKPELFDLLLTIPETWTDQWHLDENNHNMLYVAVDAGHVEIVKRILNPALGVTKEMVREVGAALDSDWDMVCESEDLNQAQGEGYDETYGCYRLMRDYCARIEATDLDS